ncbi:MULTISPECIES: anthranilate phosphoribosyltransferase [Brevibacterium]|uniref:Anthranilate phosphoribosyltransferase n=2 Tax=Brevibacterium TaxID=1696 RepID=A0A269ZGK1_9MICO|nr:anthranilate phosphoribosyltransferase [Brevibacterium casei]MCT2183944.1 anthranilate phosphoribosyltransferase [Brevibacterium casei]PAK96630.1 anthranilate phosphoribosyltransferase [Brevibacterium casei]QPS32814.1 anthranilate phosphoribosyltransferase [Brevibacterium casei]VEW12101.1 Anthranilate phosphoribosyltransferase [Brevibacterium casei]
MTEAPRTTAPETALPGTASTGTDVAANWPDLLMTLMHGQDLTEEQASWAMDQIMSGQVPDVTMAAFLAAHHTKGETVAEIAGLVAAMMEHAVPLPGLEDSVDIVGTGGDRAKTANISSTAAMIISATGQRVVKHGNRATSSASGSADVLEALGVRFDITPEQTGIVAAEVGLAFCFANVFHPSMQFVAAVRRQISVPTAFNILGPLTNPARARHTAIGVADAQMAPLVVGTLAKRGHQAVVFRSRDGLDELSNTDVNDVWEVRHGEVEHTTFDALDLGFDRVTKDDLRGGGPADNAKIMRSVLAGEKSPVRDIVLINAAAALVAADESGVGSFTERVAAKLRIAEDTVDAGLGAAKLDQLVTVSRRIAEANGA